MGVLDVEKPAFMAEEDTAIFEDAVGKFFDEHAPESVAATWRRNHVVDHRLQLFGGYGFKNEYPIARMYRDSRVQRIYGGTNEIMKLLIARTL